MNYNEIYELWLKSADSETADELKKIDEKEKEDRFYKSLEFGTGGLRGVIGAGTNRMNKYTVGQATQALSDYVNNQGKASDGVCISYDSRLYSDVFAKESACILAANGIKAYLSDALRPVPFLSFSVLEKGAAAGIMITASHNPPKYNGYKVYCDTGEQIAPEMADEIVSYISKTDIFTGVRRMDFDEAVSKGLIEMITSADEDKFVSRVLEQQQNPGIAKSADMGIVYTPLHGSGNIPVRKALKAAGFDKVWVVPEQEKPDPAFSTVKSPNPEDKAGFYLAEDLAAKTGAELIIGTDPDCDRVGVMAKNKDGKFDSFTGNQIGVILLEYLISAKKKNGTLPKNAAVIKTIVSTYLADRMCESYGVACMNVLTGFKFIGEKIRQFEKDGSHTYLFGFEESYGYLSGTHSRDKDGVVACLLVCEAAAYYKTLGKTLFDVLEDIFSRFGAYAEDLKAITLEGIEGVQKIKEMISELRSNPPKEIDGVKVESVADYKLRKITYADGKTEDLTLPVSDVLLFTLEDKSTFAIRPSGTEPKVKIYFGVNDKTYALALEKLAKFKDSVTKIVVK